MINLPILHIGSDVVFTIAVRDIFAAPVDAIVNPANKGLSHGGGLAEIISRMAGRELDDECDAIIARDGILETSDAVITTAGQLNFNAVIHAVGPRMGCGNELEKLEKAIQNVLRVAELANQDTDSAYQINSVAFPMISTGVYCVPKPVCAQAFANVMKSYMQAPTEHTLKSVWLCVGLDDFDLFTRHFSTDRQRVVQTSQQNDIPEIDLSDEEHSAGSSDIDDWFH